jgi:hypothetical protein
MIRDIIGGLAFWIAFIGLMFLWFGFGLYDIGL